MSSDTRSRRTKISVLAIDGGGIRGAIPARILVALEARMGRRVAELFDVIAGTSTGGLIALGAAKPAPGGGPAYRAQDLLDLYTEHGAAMFPHSLRWRIHSLGGMADERYDVAPLEALLKERFGDTKLSEALVEVVIPSYDLTGPGPFFFKRAYARDDGHAWDVEMWRVARATSAAPTYFEPAELPAFEQEGDHALVDGGVFANDPAACAYADALDFFSHQDGEPEIHVVSLGTGAPPPAAPGHEGGPVTFDEARSWGLARWAHPLLHVVLDGVAKSVDYQLVRLCRHGDETAPRYHRLQSDLPTASAGLDNAEPANIAHLVADAETLLEREAEKVDAICAMLADVATERDAVAAAPSAHGA